MIKNTGQLPAFRVWANIHALNVVLPNENKIGDSSFWRNGPPVSRLDHDETMEIPVLAGVGLPPGMAIHACDYTLEIEHVFKLLFYHVEMKRCWRIELRKFPLTDSPGSSARFRSPLLLFIGGEIFGFGGVLSARRKISSRRFSCED